MSFREQGTPCSTAWMDRAHHLRLADLDATSDAAPAASRSCEDSRMRPGAREGLWRCAPTCQ
jgi:hypothetical protein